MIGLIPFQIDSERTQRDKNLDFSRSQQDEHQGNLLDESLLGEILAGIDKLAPGVVARLRHGVDLGVEEEGQSSGDGVSSCEFESK